MSSNWLLVLLLVILSTMFVFLPHLVADAGEYGIGGDLPEEASIWDLLTFDASFIWAAMSFSAPADMPDWMGVMFWVGSFIMIYCAVRLVRGVH